MKELCLFSLLLLIVIVGAEDAIQYHGERRYYTVEHDGHTNVALHILKEQADHKVKLIFPKGKSFTDLATVIKLSSPSSNGKCEDDHTLEFKLVIKDGQDYIRGEIKSDVDRATTEKIVQMDLYDICNGVQGRHPYGSGIIEDAKVKLEKEGRHCFRTPDTPFKQHDTDHNEMDLQVTLPEHGDFKCQAFMILPPYMHVEDISLKDDVPSVLNATWAAHNSDVRFWWRITNPNASEPDGPQLPASTSFNANGDVQIDMLKSTKDVPIVLRIGSNQPFPSFKFSFGEKCNGATFELYLNLHDSPDCRIGIHLFEDGFQILTKSGEWYDIATSSSSWSPTLVFGGNQVYVKIESPLSIHKFEVCELSNAPDVPADQFVLQIEKLGSVGKCEFAHLFIPRSDVAKEIEVLIDRSKISQLSSNDTAAAAPPAIRSKFFKSKF